MSQVYKASKEILFDSSSKLIFFSDCHRGDNSWADNFAGNQNLFFHALQHYYRNGFTYIEIGDGDELWENRNFSDIKQGYANIFWLLHQFFREGRFYMVYGNHDMVKGSKKFVKNNLFQYYNEHSKKVEPLFNGIEPYEGLILRHSETGNRIFVVHGHQVDFLNDRLWRLSRFLVRYLWRPLELLGFNDPTSAAKNYSKKGDVEKKIIDWVRSNQQMVIAGHTHRPMFPQPGEPPYFNDGSCVHPRCITGIEIQNGQIALVKWSTQANSSGTLVVTRDILAGPTELTLFFNTKR